MSKKNLARLRRARQTRLKIREVAEARLTVHRTNAHIYAPITSAAGDKVLYVVAQHLARHIREVDFVARFGGEEFAMLLLGTRPDDALKVCNGLRERIAQLNFHYRHKPIPVTLSCGIASFDGDDTPETVFERADLAMYRAKREGRNLCVLG